MFYVVFEPSAAAVYAPPVPQSRSALVLPGDFTVRRNVRPHCSQHAKAQTTPQRV